MNPPIYTGYVIAIIIIIWFYVTLFEIKKNLKIHQL